MLDGVGQNLDEKEAETEVDSFDLIISDRDSIATAVHTHSLYIQQRRGIVKETNNHLLLCTVYHTYYALSFWCLTPFRTPIMKLFRKLSDKSKVLHTDLLSYSTINQIYQNRVLQTHRYYVDGIIHR